MTRTGTITPALSHPMGEGEVVPALCRNDALEHARDRERFSLSHPMGEGRGEGRLFRKFAFTIIFALTASFAFAQPAADPLKSRAELTNYEEPSRYEDVLKFFNQLQ